ncbi:radical SAM protein [Rheinheimera sp.]|uniref:radical SAM protein n=1 Tax=Rheinheimera sp. TaxID=1869214 RepID=UPI002FDE57A5
MSMVQGFDRKDVMYSLRNDIFNLILFPTEECNFRCVYCYEDFEVGNMPRWLVDAVKQLLTHKVKKLKCLSLSWFGGEPLVAKQILFEIAEHAYDLCQQYDCKIIGDVTTNGFLLDTTTLARLVSLNQTRFQISIDGDEEVHNQTRITKNGRGSFTRIWQRLMDAAATDLEFNIILRIHVTDLNQDAIERFLKLYQQHLANDPRFSLFFKAISNLGGDQDKVQQLISKKSAAHFVAELNARYYGNQGDKPNYICYASKPNSLAVRADGSLNKCTVALKDDINKVGRINEDGTLSLQHQKIGSWISGFDTLDKWRLGCPLSYLNAHPEKKNVTVGEINVIQVA